ncbi:MAG: class I SAM-dependent methyltransferase [Acidobacteria bacterium]|nr:MAG: class I SAM-dependent methyltransferase [Acidobacteriota bacterium]
MARHFRPGQRILEINCGTGADALHLAQRGARVVACDISAKMIRAARHRLAGEGLASSVEFRVLPTESICVLNEERPFDGALSNFAGLNCAADVSAVASDLSRLLKPGAKLVVCVFGRWCLGEILWYLRRGNWHKALRRVRGKTRRACLSSGAAVEVRYPSIRDLKRAFAPHFLLEEWQGVGIAVPPSYLEPWAARHPRAFRAAARFDSRFSHLPLVKALADHVLLTFERTG